MGIVELHPGEGPPIVLVHPLSGAVHPYQQLAKALLTKSPINSKSPINPKSPVILESPVVLESPVISGSPVIVLSAPGVFDDAPPLDMLESLAAYHAQQLKARWSTLHLLGGWSFGGLLALEIARQLESPPNLVAVLDTRAFLPIEAHQNPLFEFAKEMASAFGAPLDPQLRALDDRQLLMRLHQTLNAHGASVTFGDLQHRKRVMEGHLSAAARGLAAPYTGAVLAVHAQRAGGPKDLGLTPWVGRLSAVSIDADHRGLLEPPATVALAQLLKKHLP